MHTDRAAPEGKPRGLTHKMKESQKSKVLACKTDTNDEDQRAVTIGERKPRNSAIHLAPYNLDWPSQFSLHAKRIRDALSVKVLLLEHVGSTSVPGLSAKPVIDMVLEVADSSFKISRDAAQRFAEYTGKHIGTYLAIVLNDEVISCPVIRSRIGRSGQIEGFTAEEAKYLEFLLNSRRLPLPLQVVREREIG